jgi:hypothetical protein
MVAQGVDNVRGELKRRGLAGGGATARYEVRFRDISSYKLQGLMAEIATGLLHPDRSLPSSRIELDGGISIHFSPLDLIAPQQLPSLLHRPRPARKDRPNGPHVLPTPFRPLIRRPTKFTHLPRPTRQSTFMGWYFTSRYDRAPTLFSRQHAPSGRTRYTCPTSF